MKIIVKKVYYCDFCKKHGLSAGSMKKHEIHCTANPNRICKLCNNTWDYQQIADEFRKRYTIDEFMKFNGILGRGTYEKINWINDNPVTIQEIMDKVDGCPICTLTLIRLSGFTHPLFIGDLVFDYKKELQQWWNEENNRYENTWENF
jgi:hypothetical protein